MNVRDPYIYFPVEKVRFEELFDWSDNTQRWQGHTVIVKSPKRLSKQSGHLVELNETKVALFRYKDKVYAINEKCPHAGGPLHVGDIEVLPDRSLCVRCPWHSWRFDLDTGMVKHPKGRSASAKVYPVKVKEDGALWVGFDEFCPDYFTAENF